MAKQCMKFVDAEEMELFFGRYFVRTYDERLFLKKKHVRTLCAIDEISNVPSDSILPENFISTVLECFDKHNNDVPFASEQLLIECDGTGRVTLLDNATNIRVHFTNDDAADTLTLSMRSHLNLAHCLLSSAVRLNDPWSPTRFLSKVCPNVLPALRRRAQQSAGYLNIMSVLMSYVMTASVDEDPTTVDVELRTNYRLLKQFVDTVLAMNETLQGGEQPNEAIKSAIKVAAKFMATLPNIINLAVIPKMNAYLERQVDELTTNFARINSAMSNEFQSKSDNHTVAYIMAVSLCDRLICLNVIEDIGPVSPLFKTPKMKSVSNPVTPVAPKPVSGENNVTPKMLQNRLASFINIDTPTSQPSEFPESSKSIDISMKENVPLMASRKLEKNSVSKAAISLPAKKGLSCRQLNSLFTGKNYPRKLPKKNLKGQTKITSFLKS